MKNSSVNCKIREEGDSPVALKGPHVGAYGHALKKLQPTESPYRSRLLAGTMAHVGSMLEQRKSVRKKER